MAEKFEVLECGGEGKPKKVYSFEANAEYQGFTFHKFQRMTALKDGKKWQTLTISLGDWPDFVEWLNYVLQEMSNTNIKTSPANDELF